MASLTPINSSYELYLKPFHRFGRLSDAVDTQIESREISRIHTIIEWIDNVWYIRDISKNGVWLNGDKQQTNKLYKLKLNDKICLANKTQITFIVTNISPPQDVLIPFKEHENNTIVAKEPILLKHYHFLPSEEDPEVIIFYDTLKKSWYCEKAPEFSVVRISDGELIKFSDSVWQLIKVADIFQQETIDICDNSNNDPTFIFNLSQDEEETEFRLQSNEQLIDFGFRSHHYLTLLLARYRNQDNTIDIEESLKGWVSIDRLIKDLGLNESHINIQIHRARKQFADKLQEYNLRGSMLIERKRGQVRFCATKFKIFKGKQIEVDAISAC
ncbi:hypothetical protein CJF42_00410 [Pseudoalteromonas sp. NBT06-2]|uniref:FHA domain-containing protein n=1 Tax=Pseudoalteromonas sp. NBT06-2 TaxID=2025950 RepID=UPI000BA5BC94|nr:FHA domain-containing protein [Pseudoalteromonas sp. NBT06-2]PAJ76396.1 hypothetical protein CJF42_00410 [Pseudoalteromonas sp. NBT06-2]